MLYQAVVSENPRQIATVSYNESKDRFLYRMYRPADSTTLEKRFDGREIQKSCAPHYFLMLRNRMENQLGKRICHYYHATMLVTSVMERNSMNTLSKGYEKLGGDIAILATSPDAHKTPKPQNPKTP